MVDFDPTTKENEQNDNWNHAEQLIKTSDQPFGDLIKIFYDWLNLAFELHQFSKTS